MAICLNFSFVVGLIFETKHQLKRPPNVLFAIADDQSFPHASVYGQSTFKTPFFDNIAASGILFNNAFVAAPNVVLQEQQF